MAKKYIAQEAAINKIMEKIVYQDSHDVNLHNIGLRKAMSAIDSLPAADVVERKKGKWIKMSDADGIYWACSECGEDLPRIVHFNPQFDLFPKMESINKTNHCPNCGAKMDGGKDK